MERETNQPNYRRGIKINAMTLNRWCGWGKNPFKSERSMLDVTNSSTSVRLLYPFRPRCPDWIPSYYYRKGAENEGGRNCLKIKVNEETWQFPHTQNTPRSSGEESKSIWEIIPRSAFSSVFHLTISAFTLNLLLFLVSDPNKVRVRKYKLVDSS